jgi:hypothetical protein
MRKSRIGTFARRVSAAQPDSEIISGQIVALVPISHTLRGVLFEPSGAAGAVYANAFVQPLFIPADHISLALGWRVGGGAHVWEMDSSASAQELTFELTQKVWPSSCESNPGRYCQRIRLVEQTRRER